VLRKYQASQMPSSKEPHLAREPQVPAPAIAFDILHNGSIWSISSDKLLYIAKL